MSTLTLVATPIGNLGDMSDRAKSALRDARLVCCEDTRRTGKLFRLVGIEPPPMMRVDEHTEFDSIPRVLDALNEGGDVCVVTDAGTPGISDPGMRLVRAAIDAGHQVSGIPGPAAFVMALVISGLETNRFVFDGFLPRSGRDRAQAIDAISRETRTIVLYEAPHRIVETLSDLADALGAERRVAVCRELTKIYEEVRRETLSEALAHFTVTEPKGEFVLVVEGSAPTATPTEADVDRLLEAEFDRGTSVKDAVSVVASVTGLSKKVVYDRALTLRKS